MKITLAASSATPLITFGGFSFAKVGTTGQTWSPNNDDDKYKFGKGAKVVFTDVTTSTLTVTAASTLDVDMGLTMVDYNGVLYAAIVGGRPKC